MEKWKLPLGTAWRHRNRKTLGDSPFVTHFVLHFWQPVSTTLCSSTLYRCQGLSWSPWKCATVLYPGFLVTDFLVSYQWTRHTELSATVAATAANTTKGSFPLEEDMASDGRRWCARHKWCTSHKRQKKCPHWCYGQATPAPCFLASARK